MLYSLIRKLLFSFDPESAHGLGMSGIDFMNRVGIASLLSKPIPRDPVKVMGLELPMFMI